MNTLRTCPVCGASVGRRQDSDLWRCDNGHTIYRGPEREWERARMAERRVTPLSPKDRKHDLS